MRRPPSYRRLTLPLLALASMIPGTAAAQSARPARPVRQYTIEQFMNTTAMFGASFSPDERSILVTSDQSGVFNAYEIPAGGGKPQARTRSTTDGIFTVGYLPHDRRLLYLQGPGSNRGVQISPSERWMALYANGSRAPSNLYVLDLGTGKLRRLTQNLSADVDPANLVEGQVVRFPSYDGVAVPSLLYRPLQVAAADRAPAVLWIHGGPGGQSRVGYSAFLQYLANHGYVVLAVNNRGSGGYGKSFDKLDDQRHGEADLDDLVWAKRYLATLGYVDTTRVVVAGGSYGGYLTLAAVTFRPEAFAAGVDFFGISNWVRTIRSIPPWWESFRKALYAEMGDPNGADSMRLYRISPLFHADAIRKPLLVLQGANDPRVLKVESDQIVEAVRRRGGVAEYVVFPDEGHGFIKKENNITAYRTALEFLDKYVRESSQAAGN